jgi:DNA-binding response OmpR family regulator
MGAQHPPPWLAFADGEPAATIALIVGADQLRVVQDGFTFRQHLVADRPHLVLFAEPPGSERDLELAMNERSRRHDLRLVYLTATDRVDDRIEALRHGADDALPSSIDARELLARVRRLLDRAEGPPRSAVSVADGVVIDLLAHEVRRDGELIHLRPTEFRLLAMLAAHPGRAYTRRELLDRVWGRGHGGDPRTVDVHVRWLRSKIERRPEAPAHLITVRGVGYRLDPARR